MLSDRRCSPSRRTRASEDLTSVDGSTSTIVKSFVAVSGLMRTRSVLDLRIVAVYAAGQLALAVVAGILLGRMEGNDPWWWSRPSRSLPVMSVVGCPFASKSGIVKASELHRRTGCPERRADRVRRQVVVGIRIELVRHGDAGAGQQVGHVLPDRVVSPAAGWPTTWRERAGVARPAPPCAPHRGRRHCSRSAARSGCTP